MSERDIFTAARALTDPPARSAYLDEACGGDAELRSRVEVLLRAHDRPDSLLDHTAVAPPDPDHGVAAAQTTGGDNGAPDDEVLTFLARSTRPDSLGRLGHYEVLQVLGRGGFGIVFRAFDEMLQRVVALKVMAPQLAATSPARKRFLREARSSAQVRHENVVQVYEVAEQPLPYLAMEFIPGETLQQRLDRVGPVEPAEVVRVGRQIAEGLAAAHATDLIHRDIKPGNVLLEGGQHKVKITDFGLARTADDASISQSGQIAGTPMYMAPEQALGQTLDQRADLFSLGSVLYRMVAGRPPFRASSAVAVLKSVAEDRPRAIREIIPETPQWLCDIIAKLHAKNPDERFQSAREVADVLADCEAQLKANAKLKDYSRIPRGKARPSGRRKWVAAAAILLLPVIAFAVTESTGVTHLFRGKQVMTEPITDPDRRAAEYVLFIGGIVKVNGQDQEVKAAADLPRELFRLTAASLSNNQVTDAGLVCFKDCEGLTRLELLGTSVSNAGLAHFKDRKDLAHLALSSSTFTDAGLAHFGGCKNLRVLYLHNTQVTDPGLASLLKGCEKLEWLNLEGCKQVTGAGLAHLKDFKELKELYLHSTKVTGADLANLKGCKNLLLLELDRTPVRDADLPSLAGLDSLITLYLRETQVTAKGVEGLAKALPRCKITWVGGTIEPK
jgi:serine/threonine protein kinase